MTVSVVDMEAASVRRHSIALLKERKETRSPFVFAAKLGERGSALFEVKLSNLLQHLRHLILGAH